MRFIDSLANNLIVGGIGAASGGPLNSNLLMLPSEGAPALQFRSGTNTFAQVVGNSAGNSLELRTGLSTGVLIASDASVKLGFSGICTTYASAIRLQDNYFEKEFEMVFPAGSQDKFCELSFAPSGGVGFYGMIEISVTGSYYGENAAGSVIKRFQVGLGASGGLWQSAGYVTAPALASANFAISDFDWDSINSRWRVRIGHRKTTDNWVVIRIKAQSGSAANNIDGILGIQLSGVSSTTETMAAPLVSLDAPVNLPGSPGAPTTPARSPGTRAILYASLSTGLVDYALGHETGAMWFSVADTVNSFKWYGNTTQLMNLTRGVLKLGSLSSPNYSVLEFYKDGLENARTGCVGFGSHAGKNIFLRNDDATGTIILSACSRAWTAMPSGAFVPGTGDGDYAIGGSSVRVANYWGVNGNFSGNLTIAGNSTVVGTLGVTGAVSLSNNLTVAGTTTLGMPLNLNNDQSNLIWFRAAGLGPPSFASQSAGTKLILNPTRANPSAVDYALGCETDAMWFSVANDSKSFKWYGLSSTPMMSLSNGTLALQGGICASGQISTNITSGAPLTVVSETMVAHLTAEFLGASGQNAAYFKDPANLSGPVPGAVPVGGIVGWYEDVATTKPTLLSGWVRCNGGSVVVNGITYDIPNLNGTSDDTKKFLRGVNGTTGGMCSSDQHQHTNPNSTTMYVCSASSGAMALCGIGSTALHKHIPPYFEIQWIMRVS